MAKVFEYVQQDAYLKMPLDAIESLLAHKRDDGVVIDWAYIMHDKDTREDATSKPIHYHIAIKTLSDYTPEKIALWLNDEPQYINVNKKKSKNNWDNLLLYLIHDPVLPSCVSKYHYNEFDVISSFDYIEKIENIKESYSQARTKCTPIDDILLMISNDKIPRIKLSNYLNDLERIKYDKHIKKAYEIRDEKKALSEVNRNMNVVYISGDAGTGKTVFAKYLASKKDLSIFISGSSNDPLQGYIGQECVILDDLRGSDWKINDLLKLLDNNTNSLVKSRYSNKLLNDCKLLIITSVQSIEDMYFTLKEHETEPIVQLKRRCTDKMIFYKNSIDLFRFNKDINDYEFVGCTPNIVPFLSFANDNKDSIINDVLSISKAFNN